MKSRFSAIPNEMKKAEEKEALGCDAEYGENGGSHSDAFFLTTRYRRTPKKRLRGS